jgi:hypothetical protein
MITTNMRPARSFQDIELANVPSPIARNADRRNVADTERVHDDNSRIIKLYGFVTETGYAILHTFFLSMFEVIFYWSYVTVQERSALINKTEMLSTLLTPMCAFYKGYNEVDFQEFSEQLSESIKDKNTERNNHGPMSVSIALSCILLGVYVIVQMIGFKLNRYIQNQYVRIQIPTFRKSIQSDLYRGAICFLFVSVYEGLFFQLVIVNYNPIDSGELMLRILGGCLEVA